MFFQHQAYTKYDPFPYSKLFTSKISKRLNMYIPERQYQTYILMSLLY